MDFELELATRHKKKATYSITPDLLEDFNKICKHKRWKKARVIEKLMEKFVEQESKHLTCSK